MHKYKIYFAGPLFDIKDLTGNLLLASEIEKQSKSFECVLPQNILLEDISPKNIRNQDFKALISSDLALFNFDGTELDSGTVAEFITAKFLSIPAVVLRSDFRKSGDQDKNGENWNLMCSFYPQTKSVNVNSIYEYHLKLKSNDGVKSALLICRDTAKKIVNCFNDLLLEDKLIKKEDALNFYQDAIAKLGGNLSSLCDNDFLLDLIKSKTQKDLFV